MTEPLQPGATIGKIEGFKSFIATGNVRIIQGDREAAQSLLAGEIEPCRIEASRAIERAQRARREVLQPGRALVEQKGFEDGVRVALVQVVADHVDHAAERVVVGVDDDVDALAEHVQVAVGHERGDLDQHVVDEVQTGHLTVDPHQFVAHSEQQ